MRLAEENVCMAKVFNGVGVHKLFLRLKRR